MCMDRVCACACVCSVCVSALCVRVSMYIHVCVLLPSATKVFPADVGRAYTRFLSLRSASQLRHSIYRVHYYSAEFDGVCISKASTITRKQIQIFACAHATPTQPNTHPSIHPPTQPTNHLPANQMALLSHAAGKCQCSFAEFRVASTCSAFASPTAPSDLHCHLLLPYLYLAHTAVACCGAGCGPAHYYCLHHHEHLLHLSSLAAAANSSAAESAAVESAAVDALHLAKTFACFAEHKLDAAAPPPHLHHHRYLLLLHRYLLCAYYLHHALVSCYYAIHYSRRPAM